MSAAKYPIILIDGENWNEKRGLFQEVYTAWNEWWDEYYYAILEEE